MSIFLRFLTAFGLSLALVPICRALARRGGFVAQPKEDRWHKRPTALLGGVGIGLSLFAGTAAWGILPQLPVLFICTALIFIVGLVDDLVSLKASTKLVLEIALASVFLFFGYRLNWTDSLTTDAMLTLLWLVGITNAFNLLDNMDGLCAGVAVIAGVAFLVGLLPAEPGTLRMVQAEYLAVLLGAIAGFLVYNVHPASIFMGDSGSLLIGMNFAGLTLGAIPGAVGKSDLLTIVAAPVMVLLIPIFDTTLVTVSRMLRGQSASVGGRDHSSHRLVAIGLSEPAAVRVLWLLAAAGGLVGLATQRVSSSGGGVLAATLLIAMVLFAVYLARVRVYDDEEVVRLGRYTPLVVDFMYKRRVAEVLLDLCVVTLAYYTAYRLRFEGNQFTLAFKYFQESMPLVVAIQMIALFAVGGYRGVWRYFGMMDAVVFAKAVAFGAAGAQIAILYIFRFDHYSRTVFIVYAALLLLMLTASRASFRLIGEFVYRRRNTGRRVIVYGAGDGGLLVLRELLRSQQAEYRILGFVDDDPRKLRLRVEGYSVLGDYGSLVPLVSGGAVDIVVLTAHAIDVQRLRELHALCSAHGVHLARLNVGLEAIIEGAALLPEFPIVDFGSRKTAR